MAIDLTQRPKSASDKPDQPSAEGEPSRVEKITKTLAGIEKTGVFPGLVTETPGHFLWEFYKAWVDNGGQDSGKNRNSIRRMRDHWLTGETEVKSLHPKLTGRIRISKDDAKSLMSLFLKRWRYVAAQEGDWTLTSDGYAPFPCEDCQALCDALAGAMYREGTKQVGIGLLLPARPDAERFIATSSSWDTFASLYGDVDALIVLSRHNSTIGPTPWGTTKLFWGLMNYLYETAGDRGTIFIWIVDIGRRQVEDDNSWKDFLNFEMMKTQFRAFASFDSENDVDESDASTNVSQSLETSGIHDAFLRSLTIPEEGHREKRWRWLCDRSVIVVQNLRKEEFQHLYVNEDKDVDQVRLRDIGVTAENILPSMVPSRWISSRELRDLYGDLTNLSDASLTVQYKRIHSANDGQRQIRYFAHALNPEFSGESSLPSIGKSYELVSPGTPYDEAMSLVYWAARHRLGKFKEEGLGENHKQDWAIAVAYLRNQGFRVIRLPEFMRIHRSPGD